MAGAVRTTTACPSRTKTWTTSTRRSSCTWTVRCGEALSGRHWQDNNGRKTEWVTTFDYGDYKGSDWHKKQNPFHPNYWGQRALAANIEMALNRPAGTIIRPMPDAEGKTQELDSQGRPKMKNSATFPLWENDQADREPPNTISLTLVKNKSSDSFFGTTLVNPGNSVQGSELRCVETEGALAS